MVVALKVLSGPQEGNIYKLSDGLKIGRTQGDLNIKDKKLSSHHATFHLVCDINKIDKNDETQIETEEKVADDATYIDFESQFQLKDAGSRNGIFYKEEKVDQLDLKIGTQFKLGSTDFKIIEVLESDPELIDPKETWRETLIKFNEDLSRNSVGLVKPIGPFDPILQLTFIQGRQVETNWQIGYGPRNVGLLSREFPLHEPNMPEICFSIYPNDGAWFKTDHARKVRLNNREVAAEKLKSGDQIHIGETIIEVDFIDPKNLVRKPI